jgi:hypothetical protein
MNHKYTSSASLIAKVIRDTGLRDSAFVPDMAEWIAEAIGMLYFPHRLAYKFQDEVLDYHKAPLPCGMLELKAVEYGGKRLRRVYGGSMSLPAATETEKPYCQTLQDVFKLPEGPHWYDIEDGCIVTSARDGMIRYHFQSEPLDNHGFLKIIDNANYRESVYWFIRAKLIGKGWIDPQFGRDDRIALQRHETYGGRALAELTYPDVNSMEDSVELMTRLIPDVEYFERFYLPEAIGYQPDQVTTTVGIPVSNLIVERLATPTSKTFSKKLGAGTHFVISQGEHLLDKVTGVILYDTTGNQVSLAIYNPNIDRITQQVTLDASIDLDGYLLTIF